MRDPHTIHERMATYAARQEEQARRRREQRTARLRVVFAAITLALAVAQWAMARRAVEEAEEA